MRNKIYTTLILATLIISGFLQLPVFVFADSLVITGAYNITAEATSSAGAFVTFTLTATDATTSIPVICSPSSGNLFALGTTTVTCGAANAEATTTATFDIGVIDKIPPLITPPADQTFATSTFPAFPILVPATATDDVDSNPVITYNPTSFAVGTTTVIWTAADSAGNNSTTTSQVIITDNSTPSPETATILIRDNGVLVGPFTVNLPDVNTAAVSIAPTGTTTSYAISSRSVLALLSSIDAATSSFEITDLQYFNSFNSFIVNCIRVVAATSTPDCYNWTYAVNGAFPFTGMDKYILQNNDTAYIIFGSQWKVSTDKAVVSTGELFTVTAEQYQPSTGLYVPASGEVVGAIQFDSNFIAKEFSTSTVDTNGQTILKIGAPGNYNVGIASTGYFPNISVTVSALTQSVSTPNGGGGGGNPLSNNNIDVDKALRFLADNQNSDGSFGAPLYTDWVAVAFGAGLQSSAKDKIKFYLKNFSDNSANVTDYERHAMALMSLGINPYSDTRTNYIEKIVSKFDGTQIGETSLVNDDIFAIFPLIKAGYSTDDSLIQKTVSFILSKQESNGSWEESVDLTGAAIQALSLVSGAPGVTDHISRAKSYLKSGQHLDGGFGSSFSTSWAIQATVSLGDPYFDWIKNNYTPYNYLYLLQQSDGGIEPVSGDKNTRIWATAYAIPAALNKTWGSILTSFPRPFAVSVGFVSPNLPSGATFVNDLSTTTVSTSTSSELVATTSKSSITVRQLPVSISTMSATAKEIMAKKILKSDFRSRESLKSDFKTDVAVNNQSQPRDKNLNSQLAGVGAGQNGSSVRMFMSVVFGILLVLVAL